jgi:hypothetical protein
VEGLEERTRRPLTQPTQLPYAVRQSIIELRGSRRTELGPKKIQARLRERYPDQPAPSLTTIYNVLKRAGLIPSRRTRRRVSPGAVIVDNIKAPASINCTLRVLVPGLSHQRGQHASAGDVVEV